MSGPRILRSKQRGLPDFAEGSKMAYRLADSCLTRMTLVRNAGVNQWVSDFGGLEEWLPKRNPLRTGSQFAEGCTWGTGWRDGNGATGSIGLCGRPSITSHAGTRVAGGRRLVAGAGFGPDSYSEGRPLVAARWVYTPAKQGARAMRRIGIAA